MFCLHLVYVVHVCRVLPGQKCQILSHWPFETVMKEGEKVSKQAHTWKRLREIEPGPHTHQRSVWYMGITDEILKGIFAIPA